MESVYSHFCNLVILFRIFKDQNIVVFTAVFFHI